MEFKHVHPFKHVQGREGKGREGKGREGKGRERRNWKEVFYQKGRFVEDITRELPRV